MKTDKYQRRFYRDWIKAKDLYSTHITVKETDLQVFTDQPLDESLIKEKVLLYRRQIEDYISKDRRFLTTLKPIEVELNAAPIVKEMAQTAKKANVGPMATVAGAIAQFLGKDLLRRGFKEIIIENGGDIFLKTGKVRKIGIYAGSLKLLKGISLKIKPEDTPLGICTSSGTIGHSLSFGLADAAVILSQNAALADAVATATANRVRNKHDLEKALAFSRSVKGILGAAIIIRNNFICWGRIELVRA